MEELLTYDQLTTEDKIKMLKWFHDFSLIKYEFANEFKKEAEKYLAEKYGYSMPRVYIDFNIFSDSDVLFDGKLEEWRLIKNVKRLLGERKAKYIRWAMVLGLDIKIFVNLQDSWPNYKNDEIKLFFDVNIPPFSRASFGKLSGLIFEEIAEALKDDIKNIKNELKNLRKELEQKYIQKIEDEVRKHNLKMRVSDGKVIIQ